MFSWVYWVLVVIWSVMIMRRFAFDTSRKLFPYPPCLVNLLGKITLGQLFILPSQEKNCRLEAILIHCLRIKG